MLHSVFGPDSDSCPIIRRQWHISELEDEFLEEAVSAWKICGKVISDIVVVRGADPLDLSLQCRHDPEQVKIIVFSSENFIRRVDVLS